MARRSLCLALWLVFGGAFLASLPHRFVHLDDAWLGEQAYWLARDGVVRSELFRGFLGYEERIFVFHKLFIPQGALAIDWLGWSSASLKAVSLPWFLLTLTLLLATLRRDPRFGRGVAAWIGVLFVAHPLVVDYSFAFRPEVCLSFFGLAAYLALRRHLAAGAARGRGGALALAALLAGLGFLVHMNGLIFIGAGAATLVVERRWRSAGLFLLGAAAVSSLYAADAWLAGAWETLRFQFQADPSLDERDFSLAGMLLKLLAEPTRWIQHGEDVALCLLVAVSALAAGRRLGREDRPLVVYTACAFVVLGLTAQSKTPKYALPLLPPLMLIVAAGLGRWRTLGLPLRRGAAVIVALFLVTCLSRSWHYFSRNSDEPARHARILRSVEPQSEVVADLTFVFDELERHRVRGLWAYRVAAEGRGEELDLTGLVREARADGVRYLALDLRHSLPRRFAADWPRLEGQLPLVEIPTDVPDSLLLKIDGAER